MRCGAVHRRAFPAHDTTESQRLLDYQHHSYTSYLEALRAEVERMLADDC